tara:strand:- start:214318 stop:215502 length:1185 start_codon:yes stop_codon:yes gene_type:complete
MILLGAGGHAKVIFDILQRNNIEVESFYVDESSDDFLFGKRINSPLASLPKQSKLIIAIGNNGIRKKISQSLQNVQFQVAVHPNSIISEGVIIEEGTVVMASATINKDSRIGKHCIVNTSASIDHDCIIEDYVHISPNATLCGGVKIGEGSHIGAGATIIPNVSIGKNCTIGAGAVILSNVKDGESYAGVPGKSILKEKKQFGIIGAGGFGQEVKSMIQFLGLSFGSFYDEQSPSDSNIQSNPLNDIQKDQSVLIAIGDSKDRRSVYQRIPVKCSFPNLIHPQALLQDKANIEMGIGNIITAACILTTSIRIGDFCVLNLNCTIGHDVYLEDFVSLMPSVNLGGGVYLEEGVYVGTGATILPNVRIGKNSIIGAGAVVTNDISANSIVKGIPAK